MLTTCVSSLTEDSAEIVERVLTFDLSSAPEAAEVFVDFVLNLISSDTQFVHVRRVFFPFVCVLFVVDGRLFKAAVVSVLFCWLCRHVFDFGHWWSRKRADPAPL